MSPVSEPPVAPRHPQIRSLHGDEVVDPYAWMSNKATAEFTQLLDAENRYTEEMTRDQESLRQAIYADISARTKQTDLSLADFVHHEGLGDYWYYARTTEGDDYPKFYRCPAPDRDQPPTPDEPARPEEELLLDAQALAADSEFFALGAFDPSPDGRRLAYSVDTSGDERYVISFIDLIDGAELPDRIDEAAGGGSWAGNESFAYLTVDAAWRPDQAWLHRLGDPGADLLLHSEADERFWLGVDASRDHRWLIVSAESKNSSETWLADLDAAPLQLRSVAPRRSGIEYDVEVASDRLFIVHNDGVADFALAQAPLTATTPADWEPLWTGEPGVRLLGVAAYDSVLVMSIRRDALEQIVLRFRDRQGNLGPAQQIEFDEPLYQVDADGGEGTDTDRLRLHYQSMITPGRIIEYRLADGTRTLLRSREVLDHPQFGPYQSQQYVQRREWAIAADGTRIPISVVHRKDIPLDGSAGCLLYGYGAYEISIAPSFSIARLSLLDRGYVFAIAHVRGGGELGRAWYEDGRLAKKTNTFTDFIACARHLIATGYTRPERLAIEGGSAGGLLIGAVLNLAPELFAAAHAAVPFVDALNTVLHPELPLTVTEWEEWGDPLHDPQAYAWMRAYSPYENIRAAQYPAILATTSLNDTRVEVTEPAKWVAALRHLTGSTRPILLHTQLAAGHGGASGRYQSWREDAFELAWLITQTPPQI